MFWKKTEIVLSTGESYVIQEDYEKVFENMFTDSGKILPFKKIDNSFINVTHIIEIRDYKEDEIYAFHNLLWRALLLPNWGSMMAVEQLFLILRELKLQTSIGSI